MQPLAILRELRSSPAYSPKKHRVNPMVLFIGGLVVGALAVSALYVVGPQLAYLRYNLGKGLSAVVVGMPVLLVGAAVIGIYRWLRERPTAEFEFPYVLRLPGWCVWTASADMLALTKRGSMVFLIKRPDAPLAAVLEALDPANELASDDPPGDVMELDLPDDMPGGVGILKHYTAGAYVLVLAVDESALADIRGYLAHTRFRMPDEPPQKWRELATPTVARARVVS